MPRIDVLQFVIKTLIFPPGPSHSVSAGTSFAVSGSATGINPSVYSYSVSAGTSFAVSGSATGYNSNITAIAANRVQVHGSWAAGSNGAVNVSAYSSWTFSQTVQFINSFWYVGASNSVAVKGSLDTAPSVRLVAALSAISVHGSGSEYVSPITVSASSVAGISSALSLASRFWAASAGGSFQLTGAPTSTMNYAILASASCSLRLSAIASFQMYQVLVVSASSGCRLTCVVRAAMRYAYDLTASSSLGVSDALFLALNSAYRLAAGSAVSLTWQPKSVLLAAARASSTVLLSSAALSGRDLFLGATTSLQVSLSPRSNRFTYVSATSLFLVSSTTRGTPTNPQAESGVVLAHLAVGSVAFAWLRSPPALPPSGSRPHS